MRVFLSGPMGSGKSTLAERLAQELGLSFIDLDREIERETSKSVASLFAERGEAAFRKLEAEAVERVLAGGDSVVALGGGTVTNDALRQRLLASGVLISLVADVDELARRVGAGEGRPLLEGSDVAARLREIIAQRSTPYAECHASVETTGRTIEALVDELRALASEPPIVVPLRERTYHVEVALGARHRVAERVLAHAPSGSVLLVTDEQVGPLWAAPVVGELERAGLRVAQVTIGAGETHKTLETVRSIWEQALDAQVDRGSAVIGLGGGVVGDLAGFAASTLFRGVPVGHIPTTLLAMVDSAVGGKTGFDTRHGKNLVGTFHQPAFVLCDPELLVTLPARERAAGLAEVVKSAWIDSEAAVARLEQDAPRLAAGELPALSAAIRMSAALKARIVSADEREGGLRALLNLGHTVGHAIEAAAAYEGILHGEAVALGMVAAFRLSSVLGVGSPAQTERLTALLNALSLPTDVERHLRPESLAFLTADKKRRGRDITFVLPASPGAVVLRKLPVPQVVAQLLQSGAQSA